VASSQDIVQVLDLLTQPVPEDLPDPRAQMAMANLREILASPNVVGLGIAQKVRAGRTLSSLALTFYVQKKRTLGRLAPNTAVPSWISSALSVPAVRTDVVELGGPVLLESMGPRLIQPGHSISHINGGAGTAGAVVSVGVTRGVLSNSHVLALSGRARLGDKILYPAEQDGGRDPRDVIATLSSFCEFVMGGTFVNTVDCAVARIMPAYTGELLPNIAGVGIPSGITTAERGMEIMKFGRTSGLTRGVVRDTNFRFTMDYPGLGSVGFLDQVLCTRYSQPGDSGSLVLEASTNRAVGLHFSGAPTGSVFCPIGEVLSALRVQLVMGH
jgi:hypothetical protein